MTVRTVVAGGRSAAVLGARRPQQVNLCSLHRAFTDVASKRTYVRSPCFTRQLSPPSPCQRSFRKGRRTVSAAAIVEEASKASSNGAAAGKEVISSVRQVTAVVFDAGLNVSVSKAPGGYEVDIMAETPKAMMMHWAINDWNLSPESCRPEGTQQIDDKAVQTPFKDGKSIHLTFPEDNCPSRVVWVLKELEPENWIHNGGTDFAVQLKPPSAADVLGKVLTAEGTYSHWSLFNRFILANEILDAADSAGAEGMSFFFVWMRLSSMKQLDWYRNSSYQSKDIAHVQKTTTQRIADKARSSGDPQCRFFARLAVAGLPRGGGDGDAIRHGILNIMRENGIKEGHRPGIECHFLEAWHQKLHTNTTPEDITVCEAYIAFLDSGDIGTYSRVLWENGGISRADMADKWDRKIPADPMHLPHLIGPMKHYLWILKTTHGGADMDTCLEMAKGGLDGDLQWQLYDMLNNRNEWWVPGKLVELRQRLEPYWRAEGASRDVLLLDIALDNYFRLCIERTDKSSLSGDDLLEMCLAYWEKVKGAERWGPEWSLRALAAAQRVQLSLSAFADNIYNLVQPHADSFKEACKLDPKYITNFGEEVVRGQPVFVLSILLQKLEPMLREAAGVAPWQENVTAVLTHSPTDVLSHVAIRARSQGVLLATCFDEAALGNIKQLEGKNVQLDVDATGAVTATESAAPSATDGAVPKSGTKLPPLKIPKPQKASAWTLKESDFGPGLVGGKSGNLATLRGKLPASIAVPASVALPFGTFERVLKDDVNTDAAAAVAKLQKQLSSAKGIPPALAELRHTVATQLQPPTGLQQELASQAEEGGLISPGDWSEGSEKWTHAWSAICQVWASKWNDRAWLSRKARGVADADLFMACLLQQVVSAQYAFVVHTANPISKQKGETFGEVVMGMGEALVGNYPGRALSFSAAPGQQAGVKLISLPSKRLGLYTAAASTIIARSDSNGEDLEAFAGAGLYDSIPFPSLQEQPVDYASDELLWDSALQQEILQGLVDLGKAVEEAFDGVPQDIEGVYNKGSFTVVQSRPQVL
ncbi:MAG: carbohydrate-binding module family 45 protein [Trebouxia sp. A1-2]|nr:MAG: carbohydrate-binding module family 45 protein [Trebouxia sp. A1-2]